MISVLIRDCSVDQINEDEMGRAWCMYGTEEMCMWGFGGGTEGKTPHGRYRHRWEDNVKTYLKEREWEVMGSRWGDLGFCVNTVMNCQVLVSCFGFHG
jgi:hypothetical protein